LGGLTTLREAIAESLNGGDGVALEGFTPDTVRDRARDRPPGTSTRKSRRRGRRDKTRHGLPKGPSLMATLGVERRIIRWKRVGKVSGVTQHTARSGYGSCPVASVVLRLLGSVHHVRGGGGSNPFEGALTAAFFGLAGVLGFSVGGWLADYAKQKG
jgi:hypothetical protein